MNVLIVDDQREVVAGLAGGLNWKEIGIDFVFSACSALEAKKVFLCNRVDILLCDIEMPQENGLSLFRWVVENYPETECIFLTSHADFQYAKEALTLGSFDYILQPARYEEVEDALKRVRLKLLKNNKNRKLEKVSTYEEEIADGMANNYLHEMIYYRVNTEKNMDKIFQLKLKNKYDHLRLCPVLMQIVKWKREYGEWENVLLRRSIGNIMQEIFSVYEMETILLENEKHTYILLLCGEDSVLGEEGQQLCYMGLVRYQQFEEQYMGFVSALYQGGIIRCDDFQEEYDSLRNLMKQNVLWKNSIFQNKQYIQNQNWDKMSLFRIERWGSDLQEGKGLKIKNEITNYFERSGYQLYEDSLILKKLHCAFTAALLEVMKNRDISYAQMFHEPYTLEDYMEAYDTYEHFVEAVDHVLLILQTLEEKQTLEEDPVFQAVRYIRENAERKLTRECVAEHVHLNEDYLSRVFKEKTGYTVKEYILMEKMNLAKELLASTNLSISIIALKTGFGNFSHFSQVFKKQEGVTPNEYREKSRA